VLVHLMLKEQKSAEKSSNMQGVIKVIIFKKKKRKGFQKETGHRQDFSKILIENISLKGIDKKEKRLQRLTVLLMLRQLRLNF